MTECHNQHDGFSLLELLISMSIVAIISGFAIQSYQHYQKKTQRLDGQLRLLEISQLQQHYFSQQQIYTTALSEDLNVVAENGAIWSDKKIYRIHATHCDGETDTCVKLIAQPTPEASDQHTLTLDTLGRRSPATLW